MYNDERTLPAPGKDTLAWIKFDAVAGGDGVAGGEANDNVRLLPMVIKYDESVGAPVSEQETRAEDRVARNTAVAVPWKEWLRSRAAQELDQQSAAVAAATLALRSLHHSGRVADQDADVTLDLDTKKLTATAGADMAAWTFELPPMRSCGW